MKLIDDPRHEEMIWKVREGSLGSTAWVPGHPDTWEGFEDSAVPPEKVGAYLRDLRALMNRYDYHPSLYGHLGQGCVHCRIPFDLYTAEGVKKYASFMDEAVSLVLRYGGSISGEHGDGQSRAQFLPRMFGEELVEAFREFKSIWDPRWKMNPGKVVEPYSITENLRIGPDYNPPHPPTHFTYPSDRSSFPRAVLRCVGIGECRRESGGTMCPSYMATREEMHSTRGRARLLWEMLNGELVDEGWKSEAVKEALDLCLSCKGCKSDCPVNVDMATYKAEFLSHYYEGKRRPRHALAFGWIHVWATLAGRMPTLVNFVTHAPGLRSIARWMAGMSQQRQVPKFAPRTFKQWFSSRRAPRIDGPEVVLWPDTFNDHLLPDTAIAAVEVLEAAGFRVRVPMQDLCCGRPLYDYGYLDAAARWLHHVLETLRPEIQAGMPFVVLEPSCAAVFRDELTNLFPEDQDAKRLHDQTFLLSEFLERRAPGFRLPPLRRRAVVHGHCHHKAVMGFEDEEAVLKKMGLDVHRPDSGCCGMAGAFGYEAGAHYDVSIRCGERVLLPEVRHADDQTLIIADGFSCREQVAQGTEREALHLAHVIQLALKHGPDGPPDQRPETEVVQARAQAHRRANRRAALVAAGVALGGMLYWGLRPRRAA